MAKLAGHWFTVNYRESYGMHASRGILCNACTLAMRDVTIYLPLYKAATVQAVYVDADAKIEPPSPFAIAMPVVSSTS